MAVKSRRITLQGRDGESVAVFINRTLEKRRGGKHRKQAEGIWREVDRQVAMESMARVKNNPQDKSDNWRSAIELGELSRASEVLSADIRRMAFPQNRSWFDPHIKVGLEDVEKAGITLEEYQQFSDGVLRALMAQQHLDFGFKSRQDLSIKEALHHGGYVAEVDDISMLGSTPDGKVKNINAPVWVPHSMWNCYPDDSPSVTTGTLFYTGSMIICSYMSHNTLKGVNGKGWIKPNISGLEDPKDKDHEITWFHGDVTIPREKGDDIFLPNVKCGAIKDKLIYYAPNDLPHSRIIYNGYERLDVRNPYFISPLMKMSPTQKVATVFTNNLLDIVERHGNPATVYDGNDPDLVQNGGVNTAPGSQTPSKNMANFKEIALGDPMPVLTAVQFEISELQKGTSVDSIRSGMSSSTEQTATEVERTRQGGQIRTIDFLDKHELQGLRPFLYLQHESNKKNLKSYQFYSSEMDSADFVTITQKDIPDTVHFDVVGSKGMIEEQERQQATMSVTNFMYSIGAGNKINIDKLAKEMYQDAGNKNPERFLNITDEPTAAQMVEQLQAQMQEIQQQAQVLQQENQELKSGEDSKIQELQAKAAIEMAREDNEEDKIKLQAENELVKLQTEAQIKEQDLGNKLQLESQKLDNNKQLEMFKVFVAEKTKPEDTSEEDEARKAESDAVQIKTIFNEFKNVMDEFKGEIVDAVTAPTDFPRDDDGFIIRAVPEKPKTPKLDS